MLDNAASRGRVKSALQVSVISSIRGGTFDGSGVERRH